MAQTVTVPSQPRTKRYPYCEQVVNNEPEAAARGVKLGSSDPNHWKGREHKRGWKKAVPAASAARTKKANEHYQYILPEIKARRERGESLEEIITWLNDNGHTTTVGKPFTQTALWRLIKRTLGEEYLGKIKSPDHPLAHVVAGNS